MHKSICSLAADDVHGGIAGALMSVLIASSQDMLSCQRKHNHLRTHECPIHAQPKFHVY